MAEALDGLRVLHVNSAPVGGGVAEILQSEIPILRSLGIDAEWRTITGEHHFFEVTKQIHNSLQGDSHGLSSGDWDTYVRGQEINAEALDTDDYDVIVVHDPQPMGLLWHAGKGDARWVWRLHIDSSAPNAEVWSFLRPYLDGYDAAVFTMDDYVPPDVPADMVRIIPPAIDPLTDKNRPMPYWRALRILQEIGLDPGKPVISQVARLDRWKDPWGVIDTYRMVKPEVPGLQLALLGVIQAQDDPEAFDVYEQVRQYAEDDPEIHIFVDPDVIDQYEVSAVQMLSHVVLQKSIREGFGLSVAEARWKGTPVIGGRAGGIPLQIRDGASGFLVEDVEQAAERTFWLMEHPPEGRLIGARGREDVRDKYLITRMVADELRLYAELLDLSLPVASKAAG